MDFALDETQQAARSVVLEVLRREASAERVDEHEASGAPYDETAWKAMAQSGLLSLCLPTSIGGDGLGINEISVVLREIGAHTAPVPALSTLMLGTLPVVRHGTPDQQSSLLPAVGAGESVLTAALREPSQPSPLRPATTARRSGDVFVLNGVKVGVPFAAEADCVLVPAVLDGSDPVVLLVDPWSRGVHAQREHSSSGLPVYRLELTDVAVKLSDVLGVDAGSDAVQDLQRFMLAGACAVADGVLDGALRLTAEHVRTREQFGRALASFQAVAGQISDVYLEARALHLATQAACWRLSEGRDADADLQVAGYWLAAEGLSALQTCHHLHGGVGVDITYPLHRHYSWMKDLVHLIGGTADRLAALGTPEAR